MRRAYLKYRIICLLKTKRNALKYYKTLPPEIRWALNTNIGGYPWNYFKGICNNIKEISRIFLNYISESHSIKRDWWNLNDSITEFILPRLRMLRKYHNGYPDRIEIYDRNEKETSDLKNKSWEFILDDMIFAFEYTFILNLRTCGDSLLYNKNHILYDLYYDMYLRKERGMKYFIKYFDSLWD